MIEPKEIWRIVHAERAALIHDLAMIDANDWDRPSLCAGWTIHDVLAHLVDDAKTTKVGFFLALARAGFNFDKANQLGVDRELRKSPAETVTAFRTASTRTTSAPAPLASRLVEIIVHGEDIRRPLGIHRAYPIEAVISAIDYQLTTPGSMGGSKEHASSVRLMATDADFARGQGAVVRGSMLDLLLALTGREAGLEALVGEGVEHLRREWKTEPAFAQSGGRTQAAARSAPTFFVLRTYAVGMYSAIRPSTSSRMWATMPSCG